MNNDNFVNLYSKFLKRFLKVKRPIKIVFDCSNGTTGKILKELFHKSNVKSQMLNVAVVLLNDRPDGNFPAHGPNPLVPGATAELEARVKKEKADLGVIFDADGDRVFFVDNFGQLVDAHEAGYILTQIFNPPFVVSEIASWRLKKLKVVSLREMSRRDKSRKLEVFVSPIGHYFFKNLMRKKKASLGLEHSGHFYFKDFFYCDSGILAAITIINFISGLENGLADWLDGLPKYYRSGEINFIVSDKKKILDKIEKIYGKKADRVSKLDGLTMEFNSPAGGEYWFNVRASNTENLLRLNVEATSDFLMKKVLKEVSTIIFLR